MSSLLNLGEYFFEKQDYEKAIKYFLQSAKMKTESDSDKAKSFYYLGKMFKLGYGVPSNPLIGIEMYKNSAKHGNTDSMFALGTTYEHGRGTPIDYEQALTWYTLGSQKGHSGCQINLGCMYDSGVGIAKNQKKAFEQFFLASEQGDVDATYNLATMYQFGEYVEKNQAIANRLYCQAGQYNLKTRVDSIELVEKNVLNTCPRQSDVHKYDLEGTFENWINDNIVTPQKTVK